MDRIPSQRSTATADAGGVFERLRTEPVPPQPASSGTVVPAVDPETDRRLALKVVRGPVGQDRGVQRAARADARAQSGIDHPRVASLVEHGPLPDGFYVLMTWLEGRSLEELLRDGPLDAETAVRIARDLADALAAAAEHGIVHRDVTPVKAIVSADGRAALGDLGAGRRRPGDPVPASSQGYTAPEALLGEPPGPAAHEYALTAILFQALTGKVPAAGPVGAGRWAVAAPPLVSHHRPGLPRELDAVLARGMAIDPAQRHGSPVALVEAVEAAFARAARAGADEGPTEGYYNWTEDAREASRWRRFAWVVVALVAGAAALVGGLTAGGTVKDAPKPVVPGTVGTSELTLVRPAGWRAAKPAPPAPWLDPVERVSMAPSDGPPSTAIVAGMTEPGRDGLLPDELVDRLPEPPGRGEPVKIAGLEAVRFERLEPRDVPGTPLRLYAVPTDLGTATVACLGAAAGRLAAECDSTVASLRLEGPRPRHLTPAPDRYGRAVERAFATLDRARARALSDLASAPNRRAQSGAAGRVAGAYRAAEGRLRKAPDRALVAAGNARIVAALAAAAGAYEQLSTSAAHGDEAGYGAARGRARAADAAVQQALKRLEDEGYKVR